MHAIKSTFMPINRKRLKKSFLNIEIMQKRIKIEMKNLFQNWSWHVTYIKGKIYNLNNS